ncbi:MAG: hypothetical protein E6F99_19930 [Actinobacteria bacterium]|nr:MAG: hypothetical protein E6F99_19930 [Actinomycetota bacterium]
MTNSVKERLVQRRRQTPFPETITGVTGVLKPTELPAAAPAVLTEIGIGYAGSSSAADPASSCAAGNDSLYGSPPLKGARDPAHPPG